MRINFKKYNFGFTLAEVLITLVIIGVIAAITVPTLINKTNNQEYVSKLKKAYSTLSQATNQIISEEGQATNWATSNERVYQLYKKHLINAKDCGRTGQGCFAGNYNYLNGSYWRTFDEVGYGKLILADGVAVEFYSTPNPNCDSVFEDNGLRNGCMEILVDINGAKKPNTAGRDYFEFVLRKDGLFPQGCSTDNNSLKSKCSKTTGKAEYCSCIILREGAMNY